MKSTCVQKQFCIEITKEEMLKILRRDDNIGGDSLFKRLDDLGDVTEIEYDAFFGPYIWFTIGTEYDFPYNHKLISKTIQTYIDGC